QRRHQKLIEMSPSPVVDQKTRDEIGQLAVKAAIAVDYRNAGTAEFLRLDDGTFYFIEINARLQVEHPVTELVSGLDLVKLQIDISEFYIESVETSIPLYKNIIESKEFIKGDLSTDFLDRFKILDRLREDMAKEISEKTDSALAAGIIHLEFLKNRIKPQKDQGIGWKTQLDMT